MELVVARLGEAWLGKARLGVARQGKARYLNLTRRLL